VRILWLTKGLGRGGVERLLVGSIPYVDRSRFDVQIAYLLPWKDAFVPELEAQGVRTHCLGSGHAFGPTWVLRLRHLVRAERFDIIHTHTPYPAVGARLAFSRGAPVIVHTEHNTWSRYHWATRWVNRLTYGRNAAVIAVSGAVAESIQRPQSHATRPQVEVIVQGTDLAAVRTGDGDRTTARRALGFDTEALVVGSVGNLTPKKDHQTLLMATAVLVAELPQLRLVIIGTGPEESRLRRLASSLDLESRVSFLGSRSDVLDLLPALDVFTLSSRYEGLPIALLEAMATGIACVATSVGGVPEVITDGAEGLLVPPQDPEALAAALRKLLEDPGLRSAMGLRAAGRASTFDLAPAVQRMQEIYEDVVVAP
jgi:glycosyltransferase involved in cell wall biosynthesis